MLTNSSAAWQLNLSQHFLKVLYFNVLLHIQSLLSLFHKNIRTNSEMLGKERSGQKSELLRKILLTKGKLCWTVLNVQNKWSPLENRTTELFNIMWPEQQAMKICTAVHIWAYGDIQRPLTLKTVSTVLPVCFLFPTTDENLPLANYLSQWEQVPLSFIIIYWIQQHKI